MGTSPSVRSQANGGAAIAFLPVNSMDDDELPSKVGHLAKLLLVAWTHVSQRIKPFRATAGTRPAHPRLRAHTAFLLLPRLSFSQVRRISMVRSKSMHVVTRAGRALTGCEDDFEAQLKVVAAASMRPPTACAAELEPIAGCCQVSVVGGQALGQAGGAMQAPL